LQRDRTDQTGFQELVQNEAHILSLLRCLRHPSIIKLVTAYTIENTSGKNTSSFLFPLAEGDLKCFFKLRDRPPKLRQDEDILNALWSLSSAIDAVHHYFSDQFDIHRIGCHYDIKPKNILYHDDKFLLSDFGLSRLRSENEDSKSRFQDVEGDYVAPECEDKENRHRKGAPGRKSDIWSFGCILSEMLALLDGGAQNVEQYYDARRTTIGTERGNFFYSTGPKPNAGVLALLEKPFEVEFLCSIRDVAQECLHINAEHRPWAHQVTSKLFQISQAPVLRSILTNLACSINDFEVEVELERLKIWAGMMGFESGTSSPEGSWLSESRTHHEYSKIKETLKEMQKESETVSMMARSPGVPSYRYCYHLQRLQDSLWDLQPKDVLEQMQRHLERDMVARAAGNHPYANRDDAGTPTEMYQNTMLDDEESNISGPFRRIKLLRVVKKVSDALQQCAEREHDTLMPISQLHRPFRRFHSHYLSVYEPSNSQILVEKMKYSESWDSRVTELIGRVKSIASLRSKECLGDFDTLHQSLPILECQGYYHEPSRHEFGIVYLLPSCLDAKDIRSLWDVLDATARRKSEEFARQPSMSAKFTLASKLVTSIANLHTAG
jgi:serine/threonine protein kinase